MSNVTTSVITFYTITCFKCQAPFGMLRTHYDRRVADKQSFWCPACGRSQAFLGKSDVEILQDRIAAREKSIEYWRKEAEREQRSKSAIRGQLTRVKRRVAHGVCPCCKRTFKQLSAHMKTKHPDFVEAAA